MEWAIAGLGLVILGLSVWSLILRVSQLENRLNRLEIHESKQPAWHQVWQKPAQPSRAGETVAPGDPAAIDKGKE